MLRVLCSGIYGFLSTPSGWRATLSQMAICIRTRYFYPRPPGGGRLQELRPAWVVGEFLSTPSGWRATARDQSKPTSKKHFYPRPPGGGRPQTSTISATSLEFLSTPSGWRATRRDHHQRCQQPPRNFYPRPPGGGRQSSSNNGYEGDLISIHALRVEGDTQKQLRDVERLLFLSTPSGWRATSARDWRRKKKAGNFYPRPPGGGRPLVISDQIAGPPGFLSTPSG